MRRYILAGPGIQWCLPIVGLSLSCEKPGYFLREELMSRNSWMTGSLFILEVQEFMFYVEIATYHGRFVLSERVWSEHPNSPLSHLSTISETVADVMGPIIYRFSDVMGPIIYRFSDVMGPIIYRFSDVMGPIIYRFSDVMGPIIYRFSDVMGPIIYRFSDVMGPIIYRFSDVMGPIIYRFSDVMGPIIYRCRCNGTNYLPFLRCNGTNYLPFPPFIGPFFRFRLLCFP
ncbi:hypothetical protein RRG08_050329 [Elysia crispata]|uniref:Uncharacterized protein n=1 Tax=Elysia crispata TaxID=231223 RepID=A0AAE0ZZT8_9GAST|nr:hypothetical protein RRG08_050329 [Elysia crispata]